MDNLKIKLLLISLIIILALSVYAISAADSANANAMNHDDIGVSDDQAIDLNDNQISDVSDEKQSNNQISDVSGDRQSDNQNIDLSDESSDSDTIKNPSLKKSLKAGETNEDLAEEEDPMITLKIDYMSTSGAGSSVSTSKNGWTITTAKLVASTGVKPTNPSRYNFTYNNKRYVFNHWEEADTGVVVDSNYKKALKPNGTSYTAHYKAVYDVSEMGSLRVNYIDNYGRGSGSENHTADNVDYKHTFKTPADIKEGAVFLYWEREDNKQRFNPGDTLTVTTSEYAGKNLEINVYAVYDIKTVVTLDEVSDYTGNVVNINANVEDAFGNPLNGGNATLTIEYDNPISNGLGASSETYTVDVVDGKAVFENIKLGAPGTYPSKVEYSGYDDPNHSEGRNNYLSSSGQSQVEVLKLNTTTESDDVSGNVGEKVDITADITDQNNDAVKNGTAILKVNGKEYKAEVKDGKAVFTGVELPSESTEATIDYEGNDYYNPSSTTIQITVTEPSPDGGGKGPDSGGDEPASDDSSKNQNSSGMGPDDPASNSSEPASDSSHSKVTEKVKKAIPVVGNPIFLAFLALFTLVSVIAYGGKK